MVAVPQLCLAAAYSEAPDPDRVDVLAAHEQVWIVPAPSWRELGTAQALFGSADVASAARAATAFQVLLLTREPAWYAALANPGLVVRILGLDE
ncbi:hypothetical protein [Mangrovihabitans endophyticus]|uniref:Uncharacterized protein n=1 Tax=Mangrovihabitans endophyticus TaxID=1751298 RepID=A0A8J3FMZ0_9ACTN|nr:hypothetical protein [Mangrovihabitans endophyticus]GGK79903.1 hypothetical protein GCM10012284_12380 [Mangrovihabitans endophyticus]